MIALFRCLALGAVLQGIASAPLRAQHDLERETLYHVFVRSFRDSDGNRIGDLRGIQDQLGYLQDVGITSLLLTPINPSPFYHNYFASSFEGVDSSYGDARALGELVRAVHRRGMKIYLDQEIQYAVGDHPWWKESAGHPESQFSRYLIYHGPGNTEPEPAVFGITRAAMYNSDTVDLTTVNLLEPQVRDYFANLFAAFADPNHDGRFDDGIDGVRIDHMMDDLDNKKILPDLFAKFWAPVFARARAVNPAFKVIAEQADWGYGDDFLTRGGADFVFAFPIRGSIVSLDRNAIVNAIRETAARTPADRGQIIFIENHDTDRFASLVESDPRKLRLGAALNILLKGTPLLYYGQEIGMRGRQSKAWHTDGNDIPVREAMEWGRRGGGAGEALWYRDTGPWWTDRFARDNDSVSVEEQQRDPTSLLSRYRWLLALRKSRPEIESGAQQIVQNDQPSVLVLLRSTPTQSSLLLANLAATPSTVTLSPDSLPANLRGSRRNLLTGKAEPNRGPVWQVELAPYEVKVLAR